jgi:glutathione S-transferase
MHTLTHFRLCPLSRSVRLALAELGIAVELGEERPWEWRPQFLAINPAGELPVLALDGGPVLCGAYAIAEHLGEEPGQAADGGQPPVRLFPGTRAQKAEVRRLVDWFHRKFDREVTQELLVDKVYPAMADGTDTDALRAIRANLRYHMSYISHLADQRRWLAGDEMTFADIAAAAHLSTVDYLGEAPWGQFPLAKTWYARMKSRPAFRSLLADRMPGKPAPPHYADLDF